MNDTISFEGFDSWRISARQFLQSAIPPEKAYWQNQNPGQAALFTEVSAIMPVQTKILIKKEFLDFAKTISCHSDPERWALLYTALWRIQHGEKHVLALTTDPLIRRLNLMRKSVRRDAHKAKAFIRFRQTQDEAGEHFVAWHRSDHDVLPLIAPFFKRRFEIMRWTILTEKRSVHWDGEWLLFGAGVPESQAPSEDCMEDMWRTYYRAIFNPARIKLKMMRQEMPVRYWATMPETRIIADLLAEAPTRVSAMIAHQEGIAQSAADFLPQNRALDSLRKAADQCQGCPLYRDAHCTVFGSGPDVAPLMIVGEQPGYEEDRAGKAFIGPAGQVLNRALDEAGWRRADIYITNAVKHFKHKKDAFGLITHVTPDRLEVNACRPWLLSEIAAVRPRIIMTLGVTAGRSLLGPGFSLNAYRDGWHNGPENSKIIVAGHPAAILRTSGNDKEKLYHRLVEDLIRVKDMLYSKNKGQ